jgi:hypothetical protein
MGRLKTESLAFQRRIGSFLGVNAARLYKEYANQETEKLTDIEDGMASHCALKRFLQASK